MSDEQKDDEPIELSLESEPLPDSECLPCQALDRLCKILPEEDGKKVCEEIKIGLENETMDADEARELLASKVGRHVLATKLAEVSDWITEQYAKRQAITEKAAEIVPLKEEPISMHKEELPPLPEEMTKPIEEIAILPPSPIKKEEPKKLLSDDLDDSNDFVKYDADDEILYGDLADSDIEDDPYYMYDDEDLWLQDGLLDEEE
jgi:hypothetical protein